MKIIFFGLGSIGQRHAQILMKNYQHDLYAFRSGSGIDKNKNYLGIKEIFSWDEVEEISPNIAFITNPTFLHIETAIKCAELRCKLFIEKPLGNNLENLDKLITLVKKEKIVTYIAYPLRFHPVILELKDYFQKNKLLHLRVVCTSSLPLWRKTGNHKKSYSANSRMGGGVILDLSHEIDYVNFLLGDITGIIGEFSQRSDIVVDVEDYADILISTKKGPASVHINFLSQINQRFIQADFEGLTVTGDIIASEVREYQEHKLDKKYKLKGNKDLMYESQMEYFMKNLDNPRMMNNLVEAAETYRKIIKFKNNNE